METKGIALDLPTPCPTGHERPAIVIADSGASATLVVLGPGTVPTPGMRLRHRGQMWVIVRYRPLTRTWVAEPVRH